MDENTLDPSGTAVLDFPLDAGFRNAAPHFTANLIDYRALYEHRGGTLVTVADKFTTAPNGGLFRDLRRPFGADDGLLYFYGVFTDAAVPEELHFGVFRHDGMAIESLVDHTTAVAGLPSEILRQFDAVAAVDGQLVMLATTDIDRQIVVEQDLGTLAASVRFGAGDIRPDNGQPLTFFANSLAFDGTRVVVLANGPDALLAHDGSSLTLLADTTTPVPDGTGTFQFLTPPRSLSIEGDRVLFMAQDQAGVQGVYAWENGVVSAILDTDVNAPPGAPAIAAITGYSAQGGNVVASVSFASVTKGIAAGAV